MSDHYQVQSGPIPTRFGPARTTWRNQPVNTNNRWYKIMKDMKVGDWFTVPSQSEAVSACMYGGTKMFQMSQTRLKSGGFAIRIKKDLLA